MLRLMQEFHAPKCASRRLRRRIIQLMEKYFITMIFI